MPRFLVNAHLQCLASIRATITSKPPYESLSKDLNGRRGWLEQKLSMESSTKNTKYRHVGRLLVEARDQRCAMMPILSVCF